MTAALTSKSAAPALAGALAGLAGLATFLVIHHLWILPIWFIAPIGIPMAMLGGVAVGWAFRVLRARLPRAPWDGLALGGLLALALVPAQALAIQRGQIPFEILSNLPASELVGYLAELVATALAAGALLGALVARSAKGALATGVASAAFAIGLGHNVPLIAAPAPMAKMWVTMLAATAAASLALSRIAARIERDATA